MNDMVSPNKRFDPIMLQAIYDLKACEGYETDMTQQEKLRGLVYQFGRLIVKDCAEYIRKHNYECIREDVPYGVTSEDILNHFQINSN